MSLTRNDIAVIPDYYRTYTDVIQKDLPVVRALNEYGSEYIGGELAKYESIGDQVYAPGKWTIKEILIHLIDTERIFAYRALRFVRNDTTPLPGMEQDHYVEHAAVHSRSLDDIFEEFKSNRLSTIHLFNSFSDDQMMRFGQASGKDVSVLALGYMISGHVVHHQKIVEEKYYPLLSLK